MSLKDQLIKARAFDEHAFNEWFCNRGFTDCTDSAKYGHAKDQRLNELVDAVACAAEEVCAADTRREAAMGCYIIRQENALAELREFLATTGGE